MAGSALACVSSLDGRAQARPRGQEDRAREDAAHPDPVRSTALDRYDIADLVRLIATNWSVERLRDYTPEYTRQVTLEANMGPALRALIWIATERGWGEQALDDYRAEQEPEDEPAKAFEDAEAEAQGGPRSASSPRGRMMPPGERRRS